MSYSYSGTVMSIAKDFFNDDSDSLLHFLDSLKIQLIGDYLFYFSLVPLLYLFLYKPMDSRNKWHWVLPIILISSALLAVLNLGFDKLLNPHYFLDKNYEHLNEKEFYPFAFLDAFFQIYCIHFIAALIFFVEQTLFKGGKRLKSLFGKIGVSFWLIMFFIALLFSVLLLKIGPGLSIDMILMLSPRIVEYSVFVLVISYLFLSIFQPFQKASFSLNNLGKCLLVSLGVISISIFWKAYAWPFSEDMIFVVVAGAPLIGTLFVFGIGLISYLLYLLNVGNLKRSLQLEKGMEQSKSELSLLKSQINPHFLFNSLNTVYGLALNEESPKTAHAVQQLSEMMRFMLHENHAEKIPLQKEIDYLRNYIELQTLRISQKDHFQLEVDVAEGCQGEITPMVLIPFVENAFKHGVSFQKPSWVKIKLTCNAEEVHLNVQNSVHKHAEDPEKSKSGIGLENVRKRLSILYPEKHLFQIYETEDSFEANIKITLI